MEQQTIAKVCLAVLVASSPGIREARADEGMWLFDHFPKSEVRARYGFEPSDAWLERVRLASVRLAGGCSGSLVSAQGLVMTNHHCAHACIEQLSTAAQDRIRAGFSAQTLAEEVRCPEIEVNQLVEITDVTAQISAATRGLEAERYNAALKRESARLEKACATSDEVRCDVVTLYQGGAFSLYKYRRFQDVRLVFAPELAIASFGGDPDNFNFPRYDLDVAFLRIYEGGDPAHVDHFFPWSTRGVQEKELTFVSGHPGHTDRDQTVAELDFQRRIALPDRLARASEWRGVLEEFQRRSPEAARISTEDLVFTENSLKVYRGRLSALDDPTLMDRKRAEEQALREKIATTPELAAQYGRVFAEIAQATAAYADIYAPYTMIERGAGLHSELVALARDLVRAAEERSRPNDTRLPEYRDSALPALKQRVLTTAPLYPELEVTRLAFALDKLREALGPDDPFVRKVLGKASPPQAAERLIGGSKLASLELRRRLWEGGRKAIAASDDPLIVFARQVDPDARAIRKAYEDRVESVLHDSGARLARARFAVQGTSTYPDATFTLRLSFGRVEGWVEKGKPVQPFTTFAGLFERATGQPPFELPASWTAAKPRLDLSTPFNLTTTNDIIGGNSGSPLIDRESRIVGLVFDGNVPSIGGEYAYDGTRSRAIAVHSAGILAALEQVYHATRIAQELRASTNAQGADPRDLAPASRGQGGGRRSNPSTAGRTRPPT